jgi:hypothetical protein
MRAAIDPQLLMPEPEGFGTKLLTGSTIHQNQDPEAGNSVLMKESQVKAIKGARGNEGAARTFAAGRTRDQTREYLLIIDISVGLC